MSNIAMERGVNVLDLVRGTWLITETICTSNLAGMTRQKHLGRSRWTRTRDTLIMSLIRALLDVHYFP
jgi:hypothetical protein